AAHGGALQCDEHPDPRIGWGSDGTLPRSQLGFLVDTVQHRVSPVGVMVIAPHRTLDFGDCPRVVRPGEPGAHIGAHDRKNLLTNPQSAPSASSMAAMRDVFRLCGQVSHTRMISAGNAVTIMGHGPQARAHTTPMIADIRIGTTQIMSARPV